MDLGLDLKFKMAAPMIVGTSILPFTNSKHEEEIQQHSNDAKSIIEKAKSCQKNDPYAAKALLLTAKTLYPSEFCVQVSLVSLTH